MVLQIADKELGYLYITGSFFYQALYASGNVGRISGPVFYKLKIFVRDGRCKYKFYEIFHEGGDVGNELSYGYLAEGDQPFNPSMRKPNIEVWIDIKRSVIRDVNDMVEGLRVAVITPTELETEW